MMRSLNCAPSVLDLSWDLFFRDQPVQAWRYLIDFLLTHQPCMYASFFTPKRYFTTWCEYSQFHRRLLQREVPMVPKVCFAMCDVRDVAGAHITAMTSPKAPGKK